MKTTKNTRKMCTTSSQRSLYTKHSIPGKPEPSLSKSTKVCSHWSQSMTTGDRSSFLNQSTSKGPTKWWKYYEIIITSLAKQGTQNPLPLQDATATSLRSRRKRRKSNESERPVSWCKRSRRTDFFDESLSAEPDDTNEEASEKNGWDQPRNWNTSIFRRLRTIDSRP